MAETQEKNSPPSPTDIIISCETQFIPEQSQIENKILCYAYTVRIENNSKEPVKLLNRHWKVYSENKQIADVKGEGVIGEQPVIEANEIFSYTSYTIIPSDIGHMFGSYTFQSQTGNFFDVLIPKFELFRADSSNWH